MNGSTPPTDEGTCSGWHECDRCHEEVVGTIHYIGSGLLLPGERGYFCDNCLAEALQALAHREGLDLVLWLPPTIPDKER